MHRVSLLFTHISRRTSKFQSAVSICQFLFPGMLLYGTSASPPSSLTLTRTKPRPAFEKGKKRAHKFKRTPSCWIYLLFLSYALPPAMCLSATLISWIYWSECWVNRLKKISEAVARQYKTWALDLSGAGYIANIWGAYAWNQRTIATIQPTSIVANFRFCYQNQIFCQILNDWRYNSVF